MNPVFWALVFGGGVVLWFALRGLFVWIGTRMNHIKKDTKRILNSDKKKRRK